MSDLVSLTNGTPTTTTLAIAEGTGNDHASVIKLVRTYQQDLEEFGMVGFEIRPRIAGQHGGGDTEFATLNKDQALLLFTFMRNTKVIREFKKALIRAFKTLLKLVQQQAAAENPALPANVRLQLSAALTDRWIRVFGVEGTRELYERVGPFFRDLPGVKPINPQPAIQPSLNLEEQPQEVMFKVSVTPSLGCQKKEG